MSIHTTINKHSHVCWVAGTALEMEPETEHKKGKNPCPSGAYLLAEEQVINVKMDNIKWVK